MAGGDGAGGDVDGDGTDEDGVEGGNVSGKVELSKMLYLTNIKQFFVFLTNKKTPRCS